MNWILETARLHKIFASGLISKKENSKFYVMKNILICDQKMTVSFKTNKQT